jgi:hypothetical protein
MRNRFSKIRAVLKIRTRLKSLVLSARRLVGWPPYYELKLPLPAVERIVAETGAQPWFAWSIRHRASLEVTIVSMGWIAANVSRRTPIFESGCGCASNLIWLGQHGFVNLAGSDVSPQAIAAGKKLVDLAHLSVMLDVDDCLSPRLPVRRMGLLLALSWVYLSADFDLGRFLARYHDALDRGGFVVFDMVDEVFNRVSDNQFMTDDWGLPVDQRRPTQYKVRMSRDQVRQAATAAGFDVVTTLPTTALPPRFLTVLVRA